MLKDRYARGDDLGDGHVKVEVAEAIDRLLSPMRERRRAVEGDDAAVLAILREGSARANAAAEETLARAKDACGLGFFKRALSYR